MNEKKIMLPVRVAQEFKKYAKVGKLEAEMKKIALLSAKERATYFKDLPKIKRGYEIYATSLVISFTTKETIKLIKKEFGGSTQDVINYIFSKIFDEKLKKAKENTNYFFYKNIWQKQIKVLDFKKPSGR